MEQEPEMQPPLLPAKRSLWGKLKCAFKFHKYNLAFIYPCFFEKKDGYVTSYGYYKDGCLTDLNNRGYQCVECGHRKLDFSDKYLVLRDIALLIAWQEGRTTQQTIIERIQMRGGV